MFVGCVERVGVLNSVHVICVTVSLGCVDRAGVLRQYRCVESETCHL